MYDVKLVDPNDLRPYAGNPRRNDHAVDAVAESIRRFGFRQPILADEELQIICGHTRWKAARQLGLPTVPVIIVNDLSEAETAALRVVDNKTAELAHWDAIKLANELKRISAKLPELDLRLFGFESPAGQSYHEDSDHEVESATDSDCESRTSPGDVWILGDHVLLCADSTDQAIVSRALERYGQPALMVFDPPFDADYDAWKVPGSCNYIYLWQRGGNGLRWIGTHLDEYEVCYSAVFTGAPRGWANPHFPCTVHEVVYTLARHGCGLVRDWSVARAEGFRLTQDGRPYSVYEGVLYRNNAMSWAKPVSTMSVGLYVTKRGDVVYDPCCGSGASLLACERHGRRCVGFENQPRWCDMTVARWEKMTGDHARKED